MDVADLGTLKLIKSGAPVVLSNSFLVDSAVQRWSLDYLRDNLGSDRVSMRYSSSDFLYAEPSSNAGAWDFSYHVRVDEAPMSTHYPEFVRRIRASGREPFQVRRGGRREAKRALARGEAPQGCMGWRGRSFAAGPLIAPAGYSIIRRPICAFQLVLGRWERIACTGLLNVANKMLWAICDASWLALSLPLPP